MLVSLIIYSALAIVAIGFYGDWKLKVSNIELRENDYKIVQFLKESINSHNITKLVYATDSNFIKHPFPYCNCGDTTLRIVGLEHCTKEYLQYYLGENIEIINDQNIASTIFEDKNWNSFSIEQIKIVGDTLYYCIF